MEKSRLLVFFLLAFIVISACKKDEAGDHLYYMDATVDGNKSDFSTGVSAFTHSVTKSTIISGVRKPIIDQLTFILTNTSGNQLITGTYPGQNLHLTCQFNDNSSSTEYTNILFSNFSVSVGNITTTYVEGSFYGKLYHLNGNILGDSVVFTNGRFKVPFMK